MKKVRLFLCKVKSVVYDFWSLIICAMFRMCPIQQKKIVFDNFEQNYQQYLEETERTRKSIEGIEQKGE